MAVATLLLASLLIAAPGPGDTIYVKDARISFPIRKNPNRISAIKEITLWASSNEGRTWEQVGSVGPEKDEFVFRPLADGLYWFQVCTVDVQGKREPEDIYKGPPAYKVLFDTVKPVVRIVSADRQAEEIVVRWEIQEEHPDPATLKLEYRTSDMLSGVWSPVQADPFLNGIARVRPAGTGTVSLRLQIQDLAGNAGIGTFEVPAAVTAAYPPSPPPPAPTPAGLPPPPASVGSSPTPAPTPPPAVPPPAPWEHQSPAPAATRPPEAKAPSEPPRSWPAPSTSNYAPGLAGIDEKRQSLVASSGNGPDLPGAAGGSSLRPTTLPSLQYVRNRELSLDYEAKAGLSGISQVELWVTRDDGATWQKFSVDRDPKPPMRTTLTEEGVYGFALVVESRAGKRKREPQPGDLPDVRVEFDRTPPDAKLFAPRADAIRKDALILTWEATDKNLAENPITLEYAERREGPWQVIGGGSLPNTGQYTWEVPPRVPYLVFLKLTARDKAGNVAVAVTRQPVVIDLQEPEGHLLRVDASAVRPPQ